MKKLLLGLGLLLLLTSCGAKSQDIINPDAEYKYFFGATCPHCQELNRLLESADVLSQISIEKREVYHNNENREMFLALVEEIQPERDGVPFVYDTVTGEVAVGVGPAFKLLTDRIDSSSDQSIETEENTTLELGSDGEKIYPKGETILNPDADYILFYGDNSEESLTFLEILQSSGGQSEIREVYSDKTNGEYFMDFAKRSGIPTEDLDVPLLFHKGTGEYAQGLEASSELLNRTLSKAE